ncbi:hypothetical protein Zmor_012941 [Zophobas morio]|uniref:Uncharacterized protein n=1 Tax=Zophobas morio TaxID=2755281 RepID=A0AA38IET1_9CUCU|nr:hypothetical protein Zmor_012941 [Zophobas morio]
MWTFQYPCMRTTAAFRLKISCVLRARAHAVAGQRGLPRIHGRFDLCKSSCSRRDPGMRVACPAKQIFQKVTHVIFDLDGLLLVVTTSSLTTLKYAKMKFVTEKMSEVINYPIGRRTFCPVLYLDPRETAVKDNKWNG